MTTELRALCAELLRSLENYPVQPSRDRDLCVRARALLDQPELCDLHHEMVAESAARSARALLDQPVAAPPPKNCWLDDEPDLCPSPCVFEDPSEVIENCTFAKQVKCKTDCKYYRTAVQPEPEAPTDEELLRLAREWNSGFESIELHFAADYARAVLAKWGRPTPEANAQ